MMRAPLNWLCVAALGIVVLLAFGTRTGHAQAAKAADEQAQLAERDRLANEVKELRQAGKLDEALAVAERRLERERSAGEDNRARVAEALARLADLHGMRGDWNRAVERRREALAIYRSTKDESSIAFALEDLAGEHYCLRGCQPARPPPRRHDPYRS
jgi:tetratricopeptide (TPR) repeat protein